jgi:hypothetical protein
MLKQQNWFIACEMMSYLQQTLTQNLVAGLLHLLTFRITSVRVCFISLE